MFFDIYKFLVYLNLSTFFKQSDLMWFKTNIYIITTGKNCIFLFNKIDTLRELLTYLKHYLLLKKDMGELIIKTENTDGVNDILGNPKKALWKMSIPLIISMFITSIYNIVDAIWVSGLGADALAGVGFVTPVFIALMGIGNGLGSGSSSALSKYIGMEDKKLADNGAVHTVIITIIVSVITTILLCFFLKPILLIMGAGNTINYAMEYGTIIAFGSILVIFSNSAYGMLRAEGDANRTMYAMLLSSILNIILDPIFIYVVGYGVQGAAMATLISLLFVNCLLLYWYYIKKDTYLKADYSNFNFSKAVTFDILKVGLPASLELINNALFAAMFSLLLTYVASTDAVAVYSTGWRIVTIGTTPVLAIATALISVIGANYGARRYENIMVAHRYSMKLSIIFSLFAVVITYFFAGDIVSLFCYAGTSTRLAPQLIAFLSCIVLFYPTMAVGAPSTYVFQGTGKGITAMFQTILRESAFTIGFAYLFAVVFGWGEIGAWFGIIAGELVVNNITLVWADFYIKRLIKYNS